MAKPQVKLNIKGKSVNTYFGVGFMEEVFQKEDVKDNNILNVPTLKLMAHAIRHAAEREEKPTPYTYFDLCDWIDEVGINDKSIATAKETFMLNLLKSLKTHLPDEKSKKEVDEIIKEMTPKEKKKATSKSGKKK